MPGSSTVSVEAWTEFPDILQEEAAQAECTDSLGQQEKAESKYNHRGLQNSIGKGELHKNKTKLRMPWSAPLVPSRSWKSTCM